MNGNLKNAFLLISLASPLLVLSSEPPMLPTAPDESLSRNAEQSFHLAAFTPAEYSAARFAWQQALGKNPAMPVPRAVEPLTWWETIFGKSIPAPSSMTPAQLAATKALVHSSPQKNRLTSLAPTPADDQPMQTTLNESYFPKPISPRTLPEEQLAKFLAVEKQPEALPSLAAQAVKQSTTAIATIQQTKPLTWWEFIFGKSTPVAPLVSTNQATIQALT